MSTWLTLRPTEGGEAISLSYPVWSLVPGSYVARAAARMAVHPIETGAHIQAVGLDALQHDLTVRYVPARGSAVAWHAPIDSLVALRGRRVELLWGIASQGEWILESVTVTYRDILLGQDIQRAGRAIAGGWAARESDIALTLRGGAHATLVEYQSLIPDDLGGGL